MDELLFESTNVILLERLRARPRDGAAWGEFVAGYAPAIRRRCRAWGLQATEADDGMQAVPLRMARTMPEFRHDRSGSFRGYLKSLTRYAVRDALEALRRQRLGADGPWVRDWPAVEDTRNDPTRCLESELRRAMFQEASARVSRRAEARTWEAFRLLSVGRRPGREVADRHGMSFALFYMAKRYVVRMLREEARILSRVWAETRP